jgi:hypothetical protein
MRPNPYVATADSTQAFIKGAGSGWDLSRTKTFDFRDFFQSMVDCEQLLVHRDELSWMHTYVQPQRPAKAFLNLSCGTQHTPHLLLDAVSVFQALGVDFVAGAGRQFCCGKVYGVNERPDAGRRMVEASVGRMGSYEPAFAVQWCHSCQIVFDNHVQQEAQSTQSEPSFTNIQVTPFLEQTLLELGDRVPWKREVPARVLVEGISTLHGTPTHRAAQESAARILAMVPGVEVVGTAKDPSLGAPCRSKYPGGPSVLSDITTADVAKVKGELAAQAAESGADTISCWAHLCHREWSKFATERVAVRSYMSIVADALGVAHPDRFQECWRLGDTEKVLASTRPFWQSWGLDETKARSIAARFFEPKYEASIPRCACGGDASKCEDAATQLSVDVLVRDRPH